MNHETDTPQTDALPSNQPMLTAQSDPVKLYQQLCKLTVDFGKALDACVEYRNQLAASKAEVERLKINLLRAVEIAVNLSWDYADTEYDAELNQLKATINPDNK